jgi:hypothetical protein
VNNPGRYNAVHQPTIAKIRSPAEAAGHKQDSELERALRVSAIIWSSGVSGRSGNTSARRTSTTTFHRATCRPRRCADGRAARGRGGAAWGCPVRPDTACHRHRARCTSWRVVEDEPECVPLA